MIALSRNLEKKKLEISQNFWRNQIVLSRNLEQTKVRTLSKLLKKSNRSLKESWTKKLKISQNFTISPPGSFSMLSMDPSRLNCWPPLAIRLRFGAPAVAGGIVVITLVMVVIRLLTKMMVDIMLTKMMVVISLVTKMMLVVETKGHHDFGYRDGNHHNRVFGDSDYNEMTNIRFWGRCWVIIGSK